MRYAIVNLLALCSSYSISELLLGTQPGNPQSLLFIHLVGWNLSLSFGFHGSLSALQVRL